MTTFEQGLQSKGYVLVYENENTRRYVDKDNYRNVIIWNKSRKFCFEANISDWIRITTNLQSLDITDEMKYMIEDRFNIIYDDLISKGVIFKKR